MQGKETSNSSRLTPGKEKSLVKTQLALKNKNEEAEIMPHGQMMYTGQKERDIYLGLFCVVIKCASVFC